MLAVAHKKVSSVTFCDLVDHPDVAFGGVFPGFEKFVVDENDPTVVRYEYALPEGWPYIHEDPAYYNYCETSNDAVTRLTMELTDLEDALEVVKKLIEKLQSGATYVTSPKAP